MNDAPSTFRAGEPAPSGHSPPGRARRASPRTRRDFAPGLMNLNRRVAPEGARVLAYASQYEPAFHKDAVHLLWQAPRRAGKDEDDTVMRLMAATDDELALVVAAFIAHHLLAAGAGPSQRPPGLPWVDVTAGE